MRTLRPHQLEAFKYARSVRHPALFMEMRLGKTLVTIRRVNLYKPLDPQKGLKILIVAPSDVLGSWEDELDLEGEHNHLNLIYGLRTREARLKAIEKNPNTKWYLMNKEGYISVPEIANTNFINWDCVVLDESSFLF